MSDMNIYFAAKEAKDTADILGGKVAQWTNTLEANGYLDKLRSLWAAYHGAYYDEIGSAHRISFGGEQGELVELPVNHLWNLGQHMLIMTTSNRPTMEARAVNTDYKSLVQTTLANGLLDYYMREKRLEKFLRTAVEYAVVLGAGYVKMEWNATSGEIYDETDEGVPIYQGDAAFTNLSPFDVVFDPTKENQDHDWYLTRTWKNRYDMIAKFSQFKEEILAVEGKDQINGLGINGFSSSNETDDIAVWEFFHRRTESMPNGRYMMYVSEDAVCMDSALPYREIPIFRISPANILGTPFGFTSLFNILPIQEGINTLYSTVLTNQNAFGVQNIWVQTGDNVEVGNMAGGLNIISSRTKPEALNLTNTPEEVFKFLELLERTAETLSGVNSVARGNPEASLKSGTALALVQSMALQFMSGLQQQYVQLIEDVGSGLLNMLKDFAAVPRVAAIVGKNNRTYMKEFSGEDLEGINRVIVDLGNPLARTTAGRVQMAEQMLQMGVIKTPEQYFQVINTGKLEVMTENITSQLLLTKGENEAMVSGEQVPVLPTDNHKLHIEEHSGILADPNLRKDRELTQIVLGHIQEHINALREVEPDLLALLGQQPLGPVGGSPINPEQPQGGPPPANAPGMEQPGVPLPPGMPSIPQVPEEALANPAIQQEAMGNVAMPPPPM